MATLAAVLEAADPTDAAMIVDVQIADITVSLSTLSGDDPDIINQRNILESTLLELRQYRSQLRRHTLIQNIIHSHLERPRPPEGSDGAEAGLTQSDTESDTGAEDSPVDFQALGQGYHDLDNLSEWVSTSSEDEHDGDVEGEGSSTWNCAACDDTSGDGPRLRTACGHDYCPGCVEELVRLGMSNRALHPPSCCDKLPMNHDEILAILPAELASEYSTKREELLDPLPVYCSKPDCSTYLGAICRFGKVATCPACHSTTCTSCHGTRHDGACSADPQEDLTLAFALEKGWQQCPNCRLIGDKEPGTCNHMTCNCGQEYCYLCAAVWKTCSCKQFEGQDDEDDDPDDCDHLGTFSRLGHGGRCEICQGQLFNFIYECDDCGLLHCRQCRQRFIQAGPVVA